MNTGPSFARGAASRLARGVALTGALAACNDDTTTTVTATHTDIHVSPGEFLGNVTCGPAGGMRSYVLTLHEVVASASSASGASGSSGSFAAVSGWQDTGVAFPSSPPTSCLLDVGFGQGTVLPGHFYVGEVDGYDMPPCDPGSDTNGGSPACLLPLDAATSTSSGAVTSGAPTIAAGSRVMIDARTAKPVTPRWTSRCGYALTAGGTYVPADPAGSELYYEIALNDCDPLVADPNPLGIAVSIGALGGASCVDGGPTFEVSLAGSPGRAVSAQCTSPDASLTLAASEFSLTAGQTYTLEVLEFSAGQPAPSAGTTCTATAAAGVTIPASCDPLSTEGSLVVEASSLGAAGVTCSGSYTVSVVGGASVSTPCGTDTTLSGLTTGAYTLAVSSSAGGTSAICTGYVQPGASSVAACRPAS